MKIFLNEKNGYNKNEVDMFVFETEKNLENLNIKIKKLEEENQNLIKKIDDYKNKENIIITSIENAVIFAEEIKEKNKLYLKNEIEKVKNLYQDWYQFLEKTKKQYPDTTISFQTEIILKSLSKAIDEVLNLQTTSSITKSKPNYKKTIISNSTSGKKDNFKNIIVRNKKPSQKIVSEVEIESLYKQEKERLNDTFNNSINLNHIDNSQKSTTLNNKNKTEIQDKFDLKEAINPTMDLEEIMKFFDIEK
ncbi:MAG: hypothetical protein IJW82_08340 [Clostridia bacterium]|nr:hypothetical protein [Clostridia bacterium]